MINLDKHGLKSIKRARFVIWDPVFYNLKYLVTNKSNLLPSEQREEPSKNWFCSLNEKRNIGKGRKLLNVENYLRDETSLFEVKKVGKIFEGGNN